MASILPVLLLAFAAHAGLDELVTTASNGELPRDQRQAAFDELVKTGYGDDLLAMAEDPAIDAKQRWVIIRAIGKIDSPLGIQALERLLHDDISGIRAAAAMALSDTGDEAHAEKIAALLEDPAVIVRGTAADALTVLGAPAAVPYLARALDDPSNFYRGESLWVRRHIVLALGAAQDKAALPALIRCLDDADSDVVDTALGALEQVSGVSWADGRSRDEQIQAWLRWYANQQ
jgi:HEAT repeat protein